MFIKKTQNSPPIYPPHDGGEGRLPSPSHKPLYHQRGIHGSLLSDPAEVIAQVEKLKTHALSPDPTLPPGAPFPWLSHVPPPLRHTNPMISRRITPAIMQEALRRTPNHKVAGPDGVPGMILKHMPPGFHEALQLLFQALSVMEITHPS